MNFTEPEIKYFAEGAIMITWSPVICRELLCFMKACKVSFRQDKEIQDVYFGYHSLLLQYKWGCLPDPEEIKVRLKKIKIFPTTEVKLFEVPICYKGEFAPDIYSVARQKNRSVQEIIDLHTKPLYTVFFMGFLPGFLYLGGLDQKLKMPRKKTPRLKLPKGSVGLAENQTGIYPIDSEGGWQIIGNTPLSFFHATENPPSVFNPGDKIQFKSISAEQYAEIKEQVENNTYTISYSQVVI